MYDFMILDFSSKLSIFFFQARPLDVVFISQETLNTLFNTL